MSVVGPLDKTDMVSAMAAKKTITLERVRELDLLPGTTPAFIAAASGLVRVGKRFWVVADDENVMASFPVAGGPGKALTVFPGTLPADPKARKAVKPDLEALLVFPRSATGGPSDLLVGIGSGSKPNRYRGVAVPVNAEGEASGPVRVIDWSALFSVLAAQFPKLNIEGAAIVGDLLRLGQRGNGKGNESAIVDLDLREVAIAIREGQAIPPSAVRAIRRFDLGEVKGVALTVTDFAPLPDGRLVFTAAAEASSGVVDDGAVVATAIGVMGVDGKVTSLMTTDPMVKLEGVCIVGQSPGWAELVLVTDADDPTKPSAMYRTRLAV